MTPTTTERRLPLTPEQVQLLNETELATQASISRMHLVLATILAGHSIRGTVKGLEPGSPAHLLVEVLAPAVEVPPPPADVPPA